MQEEGEEENQEGQEEGEEEEGDEFEQIEIHPDLIQAAQKAGLDLDDD